MKIIAAFILASLLAVLGYGVFWWVCLTYTSNQMKDAVHEAIMADMTYGTAQWVPDLAHVTMDLPAVKLVMVQGPIREIRANSLRLVSEFLMRDRWVMALPPRVEVVLANGKLLLLETQNGQVFWQRDGNRLTMRADRVALVDPRGKELAKLDDVMLERKDSDAGVRLNLASRPQMQGGEGVVNGQIVMPATSFANIVNLFGSDGLPTMRMILHAMMAGLGNNTLQLENVSFKAPGNQGAAGGFTGDIQMLADGRLMGKLSLRADTPNRAFMWVQQGGLLAPRNTAESVGVARFSRGLVEAKSGVRMENMQSTLMLNGQPVGPLPVVNQVIDKLWL